MRPIPFLVNRAALPLPWSKSAAPGSPKPPPPAFLNPICAISQAYRSPFQRICRRHH